MQIQVPHQFTKQGAITQINRALQEAESKLQGQATIDRAEWEGETLMYAVTVQGAKISGSVEVLDTSFDITIKLPLMLRLFEGRIKKQIEEQLKQMGSTGGAIGGNLNGKS